MDRKKRRIGGRWEEKQLFKKGRVSANVNWNSRCTIDNLREIFEFLTQSDIIDCSKVSRQFRDIALSTTHHSFYILNGKKFLGHQSIQKSLDGLAVYNIKHIQKYIYKFPSYLYLGKNTSLHTPGVEYPKSIDMSNVKILFIDHGANINGYIQDIKKFENLEQLFIVNNNIMSETIQEFSKCRRLKRVFILTNPTLLTNDEIIKLPELEIFFVSEGVYIHNMGETVSEKLCTFISNQAPTNLNPNCYYGQSDNHNIANFINTIHAPPLEVYPSSYRARGHLAGY